MAVDNMFFFSPVQTIKFLLYYIVLYNTCFYRFLLVSVCLQRLEAADWMSQLGTDVMADSVVVKVCVSL